MLVENIISEDPSQSRWALTGAAKTLLAEDEVSERHQQLCQLPTQGEMARTNSPEL